MDINELKNNPKTSYLADLLQKLLLEEKEIAKMSEEDPSFIPLAKEELANIQHQKDGIQKQVDDILKSEKEEEDYPNEIILEVRAGVGGDEAALFASVLAEMYSRYSESRGWSFVTVDESKNALGGYKEASFEIRGKDVSRDLRFETGVHRIQRVPETEKSGRVHTSTASVAVLPIRKHSKIVIDPGDLQVEFTRSGGHGGQNVNKVETAVRIVHLPTNIEVRCTSERSQLKNREKAMSILLSKLEAKKAEDDAKKYSAERKSQIGTADRSEKIRTYNILQDRITDHRIKESWHNIEKILAGDLEPIIDSLKSADPSKISSGGGEDEE